MSAGPDLASPTAAIAVLKKYGLRTQKKYGQNFLIDAHVPEKIVNAARISEEDFIIEIGPGIGTLTQFLASAAGRVLAIEIDEKLIPVLAETLGPYPNAEVLHADVLKTDLMKCIDERAEGRTVKVVANLPYYITTPILMTMLEARLPAVSYTLMVQKEVADRMLAPPGGKDYGALTLAVRYYTEAGMVTQVPPTCFLPAPQVGSAVVQLVSRGEEDLRAGMGDGTSAGEKHLFRVIRAAFGQRRKTLFNALKNSPELSCSGEQIGTALDACGLPRNIRGEALSLEEFIKLSETLRLRPE